MLGIRPLNRETHATSLFIIGPCINGLHLFGLLISERYVTAFNTITRGCLCGSTAEWLPINTQPTGWPSRHLGRGSDAQCAADHSGA